MLRRAGAGQETAPAWLQARWHEADRAKEAAKAKARRTLGALADRVRAGLRPAQLATLREGTREFVPEKGEPDARARVAQFLLQPQTLPALESRKGGKI
ncbi:MAG: hypothetical protein A3J82_00165 [Elusimicrobia bacterium RIFOXYA2_FULL_69_6]|nr:MAG: hypothetical protein A3J82_00165 [Elusimicrobia bacterium RIFOXYA2_FULL_69_6]